LRGRRYNRTKSKQGGTGANQYKQTPQNDVSASSAERLAKQHGVSKATIERDGKFASAVEKVKSVDPAIESKVVAGTAPAKGAIVEAAKQIVKAEAEVKAVAATPLIPTRKDKESAKILEKAKDKAAAILGGTMGTIAQAKREVAKQEKREALEAKAAAVVADPAGPGGDADGHGDVGGRGDPDRARQVPRPDPGGATCVGVVAGRAVIHDPWVRW